MFRSDRFVGQTPVRRAAGKPEPVRRHRRVHRRECQRRRRADHRQVLSGGRPTETSGRLRRPHQRALPGEEQLDRRESKGCTHPFFYFVSVLVYGRNVETVYRVTLTISRRAFLVCDRDNGG